MRVSIVYSILLAGAVSAVVTGCASTASAPPRAQTPPLITHVVPAGDGHADAPVDVTGILDLPQALALAVMRNPGLEAYSYEVRAADARVLQARLLPNPELEVEVEEYDRRGSGFDSADMAVVLGQLFELGGKRGRRVRAAEAGRDLAAWDYEARRLAVLTDTAKRFVTAVAARRRLELAESAAELAEKTSRAVTERVKVGKEPPLQGSKAAAELEMARVGALEAAEELTLALKILASMWGDEHPRFEGVQGDLDRIPDTIPALEALRSRLPVSPGLARWDAELQLRRAELASMKAARVPDMEAFFGYQRFEGDGSDALAFGVCFPLPLFDRNQGNIAAAESRLAGVEAERQAAVAALRNELSAAHVALSTAHRRVQVFRARVVPAMEEAFSAAREGYREGKFGFLDVLDAQRGLFGARGALVDALSDYHIAVADIQRITGERVETSKDPKEEKQP